MGEPLQLYRGKPLAVKLHPSTAAPLLIVPNLNAIDPRCRKKQQRHNASHECTTENLLAIKELYLLLPVTGRAGEEGRSGGDVGSEESYDE